MPRLSSLPPFRRYRKAWLTSNAITRYNVMTGYSASPVISARVFAGSCRSDCLSDSADLALSCQSLSLTLVHVAGPFGSFRSKDGSHDQRLFENPRFRFRGLSCASMTSEMRIKNLQFTDAIKHPREFCACLVRSTGVFVLSSESCPS